MVTTSAPPTASSTQWLAVATIAHTVISGCSAPSSFCQPFGASTTITIPHHSDQPKCSEGIAAYWLEIAVMAPYDGLARSCGPCTVSTKPRPGIRRGGASGYSQKPMRARTVARPREARAQR